MARTSTYLNFAGTTEAAFRFYATVFGGELSPIHRIGDAPPMPGAPALADAEKNFVMHVETVILGDHVLMGTDIVESMGHKLIEGNNVSINLEPDSREDTDRLFKALAEGGKAEMPLMDMFWGAYFGTLVDKFGTRWMFNFTAAK